MRQQWLPLPVLREDWLWLWRHLWRRLTNRLLPGCAGGHDWVECIADYGPGKSEPAIHCQRCGKWEW